MFPFIKMSLMSLCIFIYAVQSFKRKSSSVNKFSIIYRFRNNILLIWLIYFNELFVIRTGIAYILKCSYLNINIYNEGIKR